MKRIFYTFLLISPLFIISSCEEKNVHGCLDSQACNYNPQATIDNNSCEYPGQGYDCDDILGCMDEEACNFSLAATYDTLCEYPPFGYDCDDNGILPGCTDDDACNYDVNANIDNGSCFYDQYLEGGSDCYGNIYNPSGILLEDFESGSVNSDWNLFTQGGAAGSMIPTYSNEAEGNFYFKMSGNCSWDWLIGMATIKAESYGSTTFDLSDNPNEVYFNVLLKYPQEVVNKPIVLFDFREDDNQDGVFTEGAEDAYAIEIKDLDPGWQLISIKYSDLQAMYNGEPVAADGNDVMEPHLLHTLRVLFLAPQGYGYSEAHMDYIIFTENSPLYPAPL